MRYLLSLWLCLLAVSLSAQCPSNRGQLDISASYGVGSPDQVNLGVQENYKTTTYISGATFVSGRYFLYRVMGIGFTAGTISEKGNETDAFNKSFVKNTFVKSITTVAVEAYYVYVFKKYIEAYTVFGIGPAFTTITTTNNPTPYVAGSVVTTKSDGLRLQYTPIGIRLGGRIGAFAELGFGYKGLFNGGVSFKIGPSCWWRGM